jgi:hypothetical protein
MNEGELRLFLIVFAVAGLVYVWLGSGMMTKSNRDWWDELPRLKQIVFVLAVIAGLGQMLL